MSEGKSGFLRVVQDKEDVVIDLGTGKAVRLPWHTAQSLAKSIMYVAKQAGEWFRKEQIADDSAILLKSGAPFTLTNNPTILKESVHRALNDRDLRRWMGAGIKTKEVFGLPTIGHVNNGGKRNDN